LAALILLLPFLDKAFHIDDPLFVWIAKHIQSHPADPYGFRDNWGIESTGVWSETQNPPLGSYYMALAALLVGWSEKALHLVFLIPTIAAVLGTYALGLKLCTKPFLAGLCALATPAFLVSTNTVMCDTMMLAFWVWSIALWMRGIEKDERISLASSAMFVTLCALTKYYGISLVGLFFIYTLAKKRRLGSWLVYLLVPIAALIWYEFTTETLYGIGLFSKAGRYAFDSQTDSGKGIVLKGLIGLSFTGGCLAVVFFYLPFLWRRRTVILQVFIFIAMAATAVFMKRTIRAGTAGSPSFIWA